MNDLKSELKVARERCERYGSHRTLVEPKHLRLEREMLERSRPVNNTRERELLMVLWNQVAGK